MVENSMLSSVVFQGRELSEGEGGIITETEIEAGTGTETVAEAPEVIVGGVHHGIEIGTGGVIETTCLEIEVTTTVP